MCAFADVRGRIRRELSVVLVAGLGPGRLCIVMIKVVKACYQGRVLGLEVSCPGRSEPHGQRNF